MFLNSVAVSLDVASTTGVVVSVNIAASKIITDFKVVVVSKWGIVSVDVPASKAVIDSEVVAVSVDIIVVVVG